MVDVLRDELGPFFVIVFFMALGAAIIWFGYTEMGRLWAHPRVLWGLFGIGVIFFGLSFLPLTLVDIQTRAMVSPPETKWFFILSGCTASLACILIGMAFTWIYLGRRLYSLRYFRDDPSKLRGRFELVRDGKLRRRDLSAAAGLFGGVAGCAAVEMLFAFDYNSLPSLGGLAIVCITGAITYGVVLLALAFIFRYKML